MKVDNSFNLTILYEIGRICVMNKFEIEEQKQKYSQMGVHVLRNIARGFGIQHPTMKKKEDLINELMQIYCGEKEKVEPSIRGRKPLTKIINEQVDFPGEIHNFAIMRKKILSSNNSGLIKLNQDIGFRIVNEVMSGYLRISGGEYFFIDVRKDDVVYVPIKVKNDYHLEIGDFVKANVNQNNNELIIADEIFEINKKQVEAERKVIDFNDVSFLKNAFSSKNIHEGESLRLANIDGVVALKKYIPEIKNLQDNGVRVVVLSTSMQIMQRLLLNSMIEAEFFITTAEQELLYSVEAINNCVNNIIVRSRCGEKILLIILDMQNLVNDLDLFAISQGEEYVKHCYSTIKTYRTILGLNRTLKNNGSISTILLTKTNDFSF